MPPGEECGLGSKAEEDPQELTAEGCQPTAFFAPSTQSFLEEGSEQHSSVSAASG